MSDSEELGAASVNERRRRIWPADLKRRIITESLQPGASAADVARRHGLNANLLFTWRRQLRAGGSKTIHEPMRVVPVTVAATEAMSDPASGISAAGGMEIVLAEGDRIIVGADVDGPALARVLRALSRR
jgi:transposase